MRIVRPQPLGRQPLVWVVIPCYRYGHFLTECVQSIVQQPGVQTKVVIIDDASPDDSFEVAQRLAEQYPNVTARRNDPNAGHIETYNRGLREADSDYLVLLSADDLLARGALGRAAALMEANPGVGMTYGHPENFTDRPTPELRSARSWSLWQGPDWIRAQLRRGLSILYSPEAVVRTRVQHEVGYYDPSLPHTADLDLWLRFAAAAGIGRVNGTVQAHRRIHGAGMMTTNYDSLLIDVAERARTYNAFLDRWDVAVSRRERLRELGMRRLSLETFQWAAANRHVAPANEIQRYVELGQQLYPDFARLTGWYDYASPQDRDASATDRWRALRGRLLREFGSRARWQTWVRFGV